jgi:cytoskeletal protein CcmA (bactofilin family)
MHAPPAIPAGTAIAAQASRITPGLTVKGEISGSEELWVGGNVEGTLRFAGARIVVGGSGTVRGEMEAREIVIEGRLDGNLRAGERAAIARSGQVRGDAAAPRVAIEDGAVFNGAIEVTREGEPRVASRGTAGASHSGAAARHTRPAASHAASASAASGGVPAQPAGIAASSPAQGSDHSGGESSSDTRVAPRSVAVSPGSTDSE